jgi:hypothetical protein
VKHDAVLVDRLLGGKADFLDACEDDRLAAVSRLLDEGVSRKAIRHRLGAGGYTIDKLIRDAQARGHRQVVVHPAFPRRPDGCPTRRMLAALAAAA